MSAAELIAEIADWKLFLLVIFIYAICPQWVLRLLVMVYDKDDPRRQELLGELYAIDYIRRPFWVAQQFETALADGVWPRFRFSLTGRVINRWRLADGDHRHREHPDTFWVPPAETKSLIEVGDWVKLAFDQTWPGGFGERMWVRVTKVGAKKLEGQLANEPIFIPRLSWHDTIKFERKHVIDFDIDPVGPVVDDDDPHPVIDEDGHTVTDDDGTPGVYCPDCGEQCNEPDIFPEHTLVAPRPKGKSRDRDHHHGAGD
jgi:hypothetical protein